MRDKLTYQTGQALAIVAIHETETQHGQTGRQAFSVSQKFCTSSDMPLLITNSVSLKNSVRQRVVSN